MWRKPRPTNAPQSSYASIPPALLPARNVEEHAMGICPRRGFEGTPQFPIRHRLSYTRRPPSWSLAGSARLCVPHTHTVFCPSKPPCSVEAMLIFRPSLPRTVESRLLFLARDIFFSCFPFLPRVHINKNNMPKAKNENKFLPISSGHP